MRGSFKRGRSLPIDERYKTDEAGQFLVECQDWSRLMAPNGIFLREIGQEELGSMFLQPPPASLSECKYTPESFLECLGLRNSEDESILRVKKAKRKFIKKRKKESSLESLIEVKEEEDPPINAIEPSLMVIDVDSPEVKIEGEADLYWNIL